jgi:hypothetical protein
MATDPQDRQAAIDALTKRFVELGKDPAESREVAIAVVDQAIADRAKSKGGGKTGS